MLFNKYNLNLTERGFNMGFTLNQLEQERQIKKLQKKEDQDTKDYEKLDNLPKINNVELKGNKTTSNLGINAENVMMSDDVTSVEDALDEINARVGANSVVKNDRIDLSGYDGTNQYTCLVDGYATLAANTSTRSGVLYMSDFAIIAGTNILSSVFVKAGTHLYCDNLTGGATAYFYPLS